MKGFKKFNSHYIDDLGVYARDYVTAHPEVKIYVGTDSEAYKKLIAYATVVLFYHPGKGAHFIYRSDLIPRPEPKRGLKIGDVLSFDAIRDVSPKLWGEVDRTQEVADYLEVALEGVYPRQVVGEKLVDVDLDFNPSKKWLSNMVYDAGMGYFQSMGYRVRSKPYAYAASTAADLMVRKQRRKKRR
jgi:predicted RNase H-related nuclease YkuK (DUF458 family)